MKAHTCIDKGRFEFELVGKPKPGNTRVKKSVPPEKKTNYIFRKMMWKNKHNLIFLLLTFFLAYIQTTEAKGQSPCFSYGASIMNGDLYCGHQENSAFAMHSVMKFPQALYVAD